MMLAFLRYGNRINVYTQYIVKDELEEENQQVYA